MMRLDKLLAHAEIGTRKEVKKLIRSGRVTVNDQIIREDDYKVNEEKDIITFDGESVGYQKMIYIMLNKPQGVLSASEDDRYPTFLDCIGSQRSDLFCAGRLDLDTEGFLFITNDGVLAHDLLSPRKHVDKVYEVTVANPLNESHLAKIEEGIWINEEERCLPAKAEIISESKILLTLKEGKFHQVKRMMHACDSEVTFLKRISIGPVVLDPSLQPGEWRDLTEAEIELLRNGRK